MRKSLFLISALFFIGWTGIATSGENKGAENVTISAGKAGNVPFSHKNHQDKIEDCMVCHQLVPKEKNAVSELIGTGTISKQQVMNTQCIKCHRQLKLEEKASGPIACNECHRK